MIGVRDVAWALALCLLLNVGLHYRPLWGARSFVEQEARDGFSIAYDGYRFINHEPVVSPLKGGTEFDTRLPAILRRGFSVEAEHVGWNGRSAEFMVRQIVRLNNDRSHDHDIHVKLRKRGSSWEYVHFQLRGHEPAALDASNPFALAAVQARGD